MKSLDIPVINLPSKGYLYTLDKIHIPQLTFNNILNYQLEIENCNNELSAFIIQLKKFLMSLPNGDQILLYDAIPLIAIRVYTSTSEALTDYIKIQYVCPVHNKKEVMEVRLNSMIFNDMDQLLKDIELVRINGEKYKLKIPTIKDFLDIAEILKTKVPVVGALRYVYLMSMFEAAYSEKTRMKLLSDIMNATSKDIVTLNKLYELITGSFSGFNAVCTSGKEPVTVKIDTIAPVTDIFQNILITEKLDETAFTFKDAS